MRANIYGSTGWTPQRCHGGTDTGESLGLVTSQSCTRALFSPSCRSASPDSVSPPSLPAAAHPRCRLCHAARRRNSFRTDIIASSLQLPPLDLWSYSLGYRVRTFTCLKLMAWTKQMWSQRSM